MTAGDEFTWHVRVRSTDRDTATAYVRGHQFTVGAPVQFDQEYSRVTALEYVLAALGADVVNGFRIVARRRRVAVDQIEATISAALNNPLVHLNVIGEEGHPGVEHAAVRVYVSTDSDEQHVQQVWEETLARSPLVRTLAPAIKLELSVKATL